MRHLLLDVALPGLGTAFPVHPDSDRHQDDCGEERAETLGKLPRSPADTNEISGDEPAGYASGKRRHPSAMNEAEDFGALRLSEEGDHRDHNQQRLKPLA